ncbi:hypothetical protein SPI_06105 [Niveomyces insectorum RCEF 264]|uniref:DUF8035 domain-containing protein n=1 Tax=Niveomyces insectorum RCEF 264 TaxID=1081102 RepID=A0A167STA0_9HYPO|nr:hypothetical protein SPI_06105 [Niveomyces insectorum RCEF 264]
MSRNPYRASTGEVDRREYDRVLYERDRDRRGDERVRYEDDDEVAYTSTRRRPAAPLAPSPPRGASRGRPRSPSPPGRSGGAHTFADERVVRERDRRFVDVDVNVRENVGSDHDDDDSIILPSSARRRPQRTRPPAVIDDREDIREEEYGRRVFVERDRDRVNVRERSPSPQRLPLRPAPSMPRPGGLVRRQSSLDTFDRKPARRAYDLRYDTVEDSVEYDRAPVRREDIGRRPVRRDEREERDVTRFEEIRVDTGGGSRHRPERERVQETEVVRTRRSRSRSRSWSRQSRRGRSSSSSSRSSGGATLREEYPKKGKTRMPARLVSERALIDLGYPFTKEGKTIVVQVALGQDNIDEVLKLSRDYKKDETEIIESKTKIRVPGGEVVEERREEVFMTPAAHHPMPHAPPPPPLPPAQLQPQPVVYQAPMQPEYTTTTATVNIRNVSPARSYTTTTTGSTALVRAAPPPTQRGGAVIVEAGGPPSTLYEENNVSSMAGPLVVVNDRHRHHHHHHHHRRHRSSSHRHGRSHSHGDDGALYAHIHNYPIRDYYGDREVERETDREYVVAGGGGSGELVRAERLSTGEIVVYEEQVERIEEPRHGVRIERDRKGPPPGMMKAMLATLT